MPQQKNTASGLFKYLFDVFRFVWCLFLRLYAELGVQRFAGAGLFWRWFVYALFTACCCVFIPLYGLGWGLGNSHKEGHLALSVRFEGSCVFWVIIMVSVAYKRAFFRCV